MRTAAEAFSGENNILPLDGRGLGKHYQPGDSAQRCHHYQFTPPSSLAHAENGRVLYSAGTAQSSSLWVYGGRQNIQGCPVFSWLSSCDVSEMICVCVLWYTAAISVSEFWYRELKKKKRERRWLKSTAICKESRKGSSVPACRSTARHLISSGNMQNGAAEEVLSLCSPWQRYHSNMCSHTHT